jgi:starch synthase
VAALVCTDGAIDGWRPDVLHANDWHTGLAPAHLSRCEGPRPPSLFTIHNIRYQGLFGREVLQSVGLRHDDFSIDGVEYRGRVSFMKAGLLFCDRITTVSPTYAREIQEPETGEGLHGLLTTRADVLTGILNGIDYALWNPSSCARRIVETRSPVAASMTATLSAPGTKARTTSPPSASSSCMPRKEKGSEWVAPTIAATAPA